MWGFPFASRLFFFLRLHVLFVGVRFRLATLFIYFASLLHQKGNCAALGSRRIVFRYFALFTGFRTQGRRITCRKGFFRGFVYSVHGWVLWSIFEVLFACIRSESRLHNGSQPLWFDATGKKRDCHKLKLVDPFGGRFAGPKIYNQAWAGFAASSLRTKGATRVPRISMARNIF